MRLQKIGCEIWKFLSSLLLKNVEKKNINFHFCSMVKVVCTCILKVIYFQTAPQLNPQLRHNGYKFFLKLHFLVQRYHEYFIQRFQKKILVVQDHLVKRINTCISYKYEFRKILVPLQSSNFYYKETGVNGEFHKATINSGV